MKPTRRELFVAGAGMALATGARRAGASAVPASGAGRHPPGTRGRDYRPVLTPDGRTLEWKLVDGAKVFHLVAEPVEHEFAPGLVAKCWGYNGRVHGPTIEAVEGDRVRIYVTNRLPAPTTVHWHGILLPNGMDGVGGLTQAPIPPGETFRYEFELAQHGTFMYHPHHDEMFQIAMGMMGLFVIHPRAPEAAQVDRDYALLLSEWRIDPGASRPDPNEMSDFNVATINGRAFPGTAPLTAFRGERVRIRIGNLSPMSHHPIHLHGHAFETTATDGGEVPPSARRPETTVLVPVGSTRDIQFTAGRPGDWMLHCHMTHHMMNQMGHGAGNVTGMRAEGLDERMRALLPGFMTMGQAGMADMADMGMPVPPNSIAMQGGRGPFGSITMGGMVTILKVREPDAADVGAGWYEHPPETVSRRATPAELERDGIGGGAPAPTPAPAPAPQPHGHHHH